MEGLEIHVLGKPKPKNSSELLEYEQKAQEYTRKNLKELVESHKKNGI